MQMAMDMLMATVMILDLILMYPSLLLRSLPPKRQQLRRKRLIQMMTKDLILMNQNQRKPQQRNPQLRSLQRKSLQQRSPSMIPTSLEATLTWMMFQPESQPEQGAKRKQLTMVGIAMEMTVIFNFVPNCGRILFCKLLDIAPPSVIVESHKTLKIFLKCTN